jgi:shikimate dehydrogenase
MRCAVLGSPITHSLSPAMHRTAYAELGLDWTYDAVELESSHLAGFLDELDQTWRGLSLTMPLKRMVIPLVASLDPWAELSGVANTVLLDEGRRHGYNTDIPGAIGALEERVPEQLRSAVVIGGGATATSVMLALAERGCASFELLVRDPARARETVEAVTRHHDAPRVTVGSIADATSLEADIVVSTVPAQAQTPELLAACAAVPRVFEVVYDPWPTPIAQAALDSGRGLVSGLDLLAHQAVLQLDLMTGKPVAVDLVRDAATAELGRRASLGRTASADADTL